MNRYIVLSFAFMALAFYELSGGADYEPRLQADAANQPQVTRAVSSATSLDPIISTRQTARRSAAAPAEAMVVQASLTTQTAPAIAAPKPSPELATFSNPVILPKVEGSKVSMMLKPATAKPEQIEVDTDMRQVSGKRVNMRNGPGKSFSVVTRLLKGDDVEVLSDLGDGWLKLRVVASGDVGYMADWLVTAAN